MIEFGTFCCRMAALPIKPGKVGVEEAIEQVHRIRITLSSKNVKNLEKGKSIRAVPKSLALSNVFVRAVLSTISGTEALFVARGSNDGLSNAWELSTCSLCRSD